MALRRPPEPKWNWKQPPSPYPECPGANTCLLGPSGSGKSYVLTALLLGPYKRVFQEIHVFSPSWGLDNIWDEVEKHAKSLDGPDFKSSFHDRFDEEALQEILTRQRARVTQLKKQKSQSPLPQCAILLDDLADTAGSQHRRDATCERQAHRLLYLLLRPETHRAAPRDPHKPSCHPGVGSQK